MATPTSTASWTRRHARGGLPSCARPAASRERTHSRAGRLSSDPASLRSPADVSVHEFELLARIRDRCAVAREDVRLGIGDDAALLAVPAGHILAVSMDTLIAGVHFPANTRAFDVGWKSLAVNLSDLAAMGATPAWATLALTLPDSDAQWVGQFADGFAALAGEFKLALVGGDTTQGPLSITVTVHGF